MKVLWRISFLVTLQNLRSPSYSKVSELWLVNWLVKFNCSLTMELTPWFNWSVSFQSFYIFKKEVDERLSSKFSEVVQYI